MDALFAMAILTLVFNVLDSYTTHLGFKQYPEKDLKGEANPIMRRLMLKNKGLAEFIKQGVVVVIVIYCIFHKDMMALSFFGIALGLVVLNNTYVVVIRAILKRRVISPVKALQELTHISDTLAYFVVVSIIAGVAYLISYLIWS